MESHDSFTRRSVEVSLPKFSISADASLGKVLQAMGVINAFSDSADFAGISAWPKLKVSKVGKAPRLWCTMSPQAQSLGGHFNFLLRPQVSHRAVLDVDETGTKAAASTTIEIMPMSMPETMRMDRPFLVLILEHSTRSILFMGKINNPASE